MPIRPLDAIKSQEASQIKYMENQRLINAQLQSNKNMQNAIREETTRANETSKSDNPEYRYDAKEKGKNSHHGSKKQKEREESKKKKTNNLKKTGGIDILI